MTTLIGLLVCALAIAVFLVLSWAIERRFGKDGSIVILNIAIIGTAGYLILVMAGEIGATVIGLFS